MTTVDAVGPVIGFLPAIDAAYTSIAEMRTIGDRGLGPADTPHRAR
jgi:hypothetical protein